MLVVMKSATTPRRDSGRCDGIEQLGFRGSSTPRGQRTAIASPENKGVERGTSKRLRSRRVIRAPRPTSWASRDVKEEDTVVQLPGTDAAIVDAPWPLSPGPCSIESGDQAIAIAGQVAARAHSSSAAAHQPRTCHMPSRASA